MTEVESSLKLNNKFKWVFVLNGHCTKSLIVLYQLEGAILFLIKNTSIAIEDLEDYIYLVQKFLAIKTFSSDYSTENERYILDVLSLTLEINSIVWSYLQ